jgi:thiol-disulfide isomerase/thioredoxin
MADEKKSFPGMRLAAIAALAGVVAGAIGVYVMGGMSGNAGTGAGAGAGTATASCAASTALAQAVDETASGEVAGMLAADPPRPLGDLAFNDPDGEPMTLAALEGRTLLINLWATWCAPCRHEMPALDALQAQRGGDDFEVVAVNVDTGDDVKPLRFLEETGIESLAYYRDNTLGLFNDLKRRGLALGLPVTLLVDGDGCLVGHMNGPAEWASQDALRLVDAVRKAERPSEAGLPDS